MLLERRAKRCAAGLTQLAEQLKLRYLWLYAVATKRLHAFLQVDLHVSIKRHYIANLEFIMSLARCQHDFSLILARF